jgi:hypothetical protein
MNKDQMIELHQNFARIKDQIEEMGTHSDRFEEYDELGVTPDRQHCSKEEHKHAIFLLGEAIADSLSEDEFSQIGRLRERMSEMKEDTAT